MISFEVPLQKSTSRRWVNFFVLLSHFLLLCTVLLSSPFKKTIETSKKLIVRTIKLQESQAIAPPVDQPMQSLAKTAVQIEPEVIEPAFQTIQEPEPIPQEDAFVEEREVEQIISRQVTPQIKEEVISPEVTREAPKHEEVKAQPEPKSAPKVASQPVKKVTPSPQVKKKKIEKKAQAQAPTKKSPPKKIAAQKSTPKKPAKTAPNTTAKPKDKPKPIAAKKAPSQEAINKKAEEERALQKERENKLSLIAQALTSLDSSTATGHEKEALQSGTSKAYSTKAPQAIGSLQSDAIVKVGSEEAALSPQEKTYYDELIYRLKLALKLPEYGEVKLKLTLTRIGKVIKVAVTSAKSRKNREYIEKMLPQISFPRFGNNFSSDKDHTFHLNLSNELSY
jgi:hypothetical protein